MTKQEILKEMKQVKARFDELRELALFEVFNNIDNNKAWEYVEERQKCLDRYTELKDMYLEVVLKEQEEQLKLSVIDIRNREA